MINFIDDCIANEIPNAPSEHITVPSDNTHPCSVRPIPDLSAKIARKKDLHNIVKSCQSHRHSATCYKYWRQGQPRECRFGLGDHRYREKTEFDLTTGELQMRCLDGLVNNFNTSIIELIRCNMDIQFLGSGPSTKAVIYYITDYITKAQLKTHVAYAALALAVQKLEATTLSDDLPTTRAKRLLQKCAYSMIAHQELSGQQVASYLQDFEDHFTSHTFEPIYWTTYEQFVNRALPLTDHVIPSNEEACETDIEPPLFDNIDETVPQPSNLDSDETDDVGLDDIMISTDESGEIKIFTPQIQNYLLRGNDLAPLSLWEYTSMIQKISKKHARLNLNNPPQYDHTMSMAMDDDSYSRPKYEFDPNHPDYTTHIQQLRHPDRRPISTPLGPSLPRRDKTDHYEKYCRLMLILFKPWNTPSDLTLGYNAFQTAFQAFITDNEKWKPLLDNMQLLHECRDNRDDHFESRSRARKTHATKNALGVGANSYDDFESESADDINNVLLRHLASIDDSQSEHISESHNTVGQCLQEAHLQGLFTHDDHSNAFPDQLGCVQNYDTLLHEQDWEEEYQRRKEHWKSNIISEQESATLTVVSNQAVSETTISNLTKLPLSENPSLRRQEKQSSDKSTSDNLINMQKIQSEFTLNEMQTKAYKMIAEHSLTKKPEQLRMYIAGPGGTGKSRVIDAVRQFFHDQNQHTRLRLASFTGVASRNIRGMTLHSALCLNKRKTRSDKAKAELIAMWQKVDYLIIDEVSMIRLPAG
jgi:hypothetical protein